MEIGAASESWAVAGTIRAHIPPEPASVGASGEAHRIENPVGFDPAKGAVMVLPNW
jgi:hypothetical protein